MIVYNKFNMEYQLKGTPINSDKTGKFYRVESMPDKQIKIYNKNYQTKEQEISVISAINGDVPMEKEYPNEVLYQKGKFVGYLADYEEQIQPEPEVEPEKKPEPAPVANPILVLLASAAMGILFSILFCTLIFDSIAATWSSTLAFYNFNGIPMMIGGLVASLVCAYFLRNKGFLTLIPTALAYVGGATAICGIEFLLIELITFLGKIIVPVLSFVVGGVIIVFVVRSLLSSMGFRL